MINDSDLPEVLRLERTGETTFRVPAETDGRMRDVVFGGQLLSQAIVASATVNGWTREVKSIHAIFARAASYGHDLEIDVDSMHAGRTLGSDTVTFRQGDKVMSRAMLLLTVDEPDLLRYQTVTKPIVGSPEEAPEGSGPDLVFPHSARRIVGGIDTWAENQPVLPPVRNVWTRYEQDLPNPHPVLSQAILAWATDGYCIGTSMLPTTKIWEHQAHRQISTGVVSHTVNFHDRFDARQWMLLKNDVIWTGRGRIHGRGEVYTEPGQLIASFTQDALVRGFSDRQDHAGEYQRIM